MEIEKVKEFAELVQNDLKQADEDQTMMEDALQEAICMILYLSVVLGGAKIVSLYRNVKGVWL